MTSIHGSTLLHRSAFRTPAALTATVLCAPLGCQPPFLGTWAEVGPDERPWDTPRKEWSVLDLNADGTGTFTATAKANDCASVKKTYNLRVEISEEAVGIQSSALQALWPHRVDADLTVWADDIETAAASGFFNQSILEDEPKGEGYKQRLKCSLATDDLLCFHGQGRPTDEPDDTSTSATAEPVIDVYACRAFFRPADLDSYHVGFYFDEGPNGVICPADPRDQEILESTELSCEG